MELPQWKIQEWICWYISIASKTLDSLKSLSFNVQSPASSAHSPQSSFQRTASRVQRPVSKVQRQEFSVQSLASRVQCPQSNSRVQIPRIPVCRYNSNLLQLTSIEVLWEKTTLRNVQLFIRRKLTLESLKQNQCRWFTCPYSIQIIPLLWIIATKP